MGKSVNDLDDWLNDMATASLPGGVAAGTLSGAMGAALIAKAGRVSLRHGTPNSAVEDMVATADKGRDQLLHLVEEDVQAYRQVLRQQDDEAWLAATEVPVRVAEICHTLLAQLHRVCMECWPGVAVDLEIGIDLLEVARCAALRAAQENSSHLKSGPQADGQRRRLAALVDETS